jgi:hypothetical protein
MINADDAVVINPRKPRITPEMIKLRDDITSTDDKERMRDLKQQLRSTCQSDVHFEVVVRALKWSKVMSVWLYPEVLNSLPKVSSDSFDELKLDDTEEKDMLVESRYKINLFYFFESIMLTSMNDQSYLFTAIFMVYVPRKPEVRCT